MIALKKIDKKLLEINRLKSKLEKRRAKIQGTNLNKLFRKLTKIGIGLLPEESIVEIVKQEVSRVKDTEDELS